MARCRFDPLAYVDPQPSPAIIHALGFVNRWFILPIALRIPHVDLPAEDLARLRAVVRPGAAAFVAPNHPEFMTDWMLDKEVSRRVSPLMAHWASYEIVNIAKIPQWLWLRNNLIANAPGGGGRAYSVRWARTGRGVLLHPEGTPTWRGERIGPLVPGVVQMAWETRHTQAGLPVYVVPLVWKLHFLGDVSAALAREIDYMERRLGVPHQAPAPLEQRFAGLQKEVLAVSLARHGAPEAKRAGEIADHEFFALQAAHAARLLGELESRHGRSAGDEARRFHGLRRAIHAQAATDAGAACRDRRTLMEIERLHRFTRTDYGGPTLTQEQIGETLKQTRLALFTRGLRDGLHGVLPVAVAPRIARIRVPEPIAVHTAFARGGEEAAEQDALLALLAGRLQGALDGLRTEIAPDVDPFRRPNPFAGGPV